MMTSFHETGFKSCTHFESVFHCASDQLHIHFSCQGQSLPPHKKTTLLFHSLETVSFQCFVALRFNHFCIDHCNEMSEQFKGRVLKILLRTI